MPFIKTPFFSRGFAPGLGVLVLLSACGGYSEQFIVTDARNGIVSLNEFSTRGSTGRYPASLQPIKASHPVAWSPDTVAQILSGVQIGIIPSDSSGDGRVIKPAPLFTASEVAGLAQGIATALRQADPNHYVKFVVGSDPESIDGTLYVDGPVVRFTLNHYRSTVRRRDDALAIYALSFIPQSAHIASLRTHNWIEGDANNPHLAIEYGKLPAGPTVKELPATPPVQQPAAQTSPSPGTQDMRVIMERQAKELESLKGQLDSLKKQMEGRPPASTTAP